MRGSAAKLRALTEAIVAICAIVWVCETFHRNFFFHDETLRLFGPIFQYIGRSLLRGEWPLLTLDVMQGGYLLAEHQYGLLNPVTMGTAAIAALMPTVKSGALSIITIHLILIWLGASRLATNFGINGLARLTFVFLVVSNNFLLYWSASSWTAGLIGQTWFIWSLAILTAPRLSSATIAAGAFCFYAVLNSGWPHALISAGTLICAIALAAAFRREWERVVALTIIATAATIASLPAVLTTAEALTVTERVSSFSNNWALVPMLSDIINVGAPSYLPRLNTFSGASATSTPIFFLAWFAFAVLPMIKLNWRSLASTRLLGVIIGSSILLLASLGPEQLGPLRWPFRFVPHAQIGFLIVIFALLMASGLRSVSIRTVALCITLVAVPQLLALQTTPTDAAVHIRMTILLAIIALSALGIAKWNPRHFWTVALLGSIAIFVFTHYCFPINRDIHFEAKRPAAEQPPRYEAITFTESAPTTQNYEFSVLKRPWWLSTEENLSGYLRLTTGRRSVNGYSPMPHARLSSLFCLEQEGEPCDRAWSRLFQKEALTNMRYVDLLRIDRLLVPAFDGVTEPKTAQLAPEWRQAYTGERVVQLEREAQFPPGTLSYVGDSLIIVPDPSFDRADAQREIFRVTTRATGIDGPPPSLHRTLIFARLWWPGYTARIDGRPAPVVPHDDLLVRVDVPETLAGSAEIALSFHPLSHGVRPYLIPISVALLLIGLVFLPKLNSLARLMVNGRR